MKPTCSRHQGISRQSALPETHLSWRTQLPLYSTSAKLFLWTVIAFQKHPQHPSRPMRQQLHVTNSSSGTTCRLHGYPGRRRVQCRKAPEDAVTLHDDQQILFGPRKAQRKRGYGNKQVSLRAARSPCDVLRIKVPTRFES